LKTQFFNTLLYFDVLELAQSFNLSFDPNIKIQQAVAQKPNSRISESLSFDK
jgi:hypothetical protein